MFNQKMNKYSCKKLQFIFFEVTANLNEYQKNAKNIHIT